MSLLIQSKLENHRDIYNRMKNEGRKDLIAQLVLERIDKEIKILERKVNNVEETRQIRRKESIKHRYTAKTSQFFKETFSRYRLIYGEYCCAMLRRITTNVLRAQEGTK
jgi:predicted transposase YbfD/YdcC